MTNRIEFNQLMNFNELVEITKGHIESSKNPKGVFKPTCFEELDRCIRGLEAGKITAVVGRPSMGKTLFTLNIIRNIVTEGTPILVFSLSLCKEEWTKCFLCSSAQIDLHKARIGYINEEETGRLNDSAKKLSSLPLYVVDDARKLESIKKIISESIKEYKIELVLIDGVSNIFGNQLQSQKTRGHRYDKQLSIIKEIAAQYDIPFMITQNLSRRIERNPHSYIPKYEFGLKEGNLSVHASRILHIYREEYYRPKKSNRGVMNIRIPAMRYGECDSSVIVHFDRSTGLIKEFKSLPFDPDRGKV